MVAKNLWRDGQWEAVLILLSLLGGFLALWIYITGCSVGGRFETDTTFTEPVIAVDWQIKVTSPLLGLDDDGDPSTSTIGAAGGPD